MEDFLDKLNSMQDRAYAYVRIFLGLVLAFRGLMIIIKPETVGALVSAENVYMGYRYVSIIHLIGGILLAIGFFTRLAAFIQIPVLIGAIFFVNPEEGIMQSGQSLELSVMVLFLLVIFTVFGSGPLSFKGKAIDDD